MQSIIIDPTRPETIVQTLQAIGRAQIHFRSIMPVEMSPALIEGNEIHASLQDKDEDRK